MNAARLLGAYLRARPLTTLLTVLLVALGMATVVIVTLVTKQAEARLSRDAAGVDLVVGAKGSPLQLVVRGASTTSTCRRATCRSRRSPSCARNRLVARAIPLSLGDSFRGFRIVGTEPEYLALHGARLARGRVFEAPMQAVIGARVAAAPGSTSACASSARTGSSRAARSTGTIRTRSSACSRRPAAWSTGWS